MTTERRFLKGLLAAWVLVTIGAFCPSPAAAEQSDLGHFSRLHEKIVDHLPEKIWEHVSSNPLEQIKHKIHEALDKHRPNGEYSHPQDGEYSHPEPPPIKEKVYGAIERIKEKIEHAKEKVEHVKEKIAYAKEKIAWKFESIKSKIDEIKYWIKEKHSGHSSDSDWPSEYTHLDPFHGPGWKEDPQPASGASYEFTDTFLLVGDSEETSASHASSVLTDETALASHAVPNPEPSAWILGILALAAFTAFAARRTSRASA